MSPERTHHQASLRRKRENLKVRRGRGLIHDLKDFFKSYGYGNAKRSVVNGGLLEGGGG